MMKQKFKQKAKRSYQDKTVSKLLEQTRFLKYRNKKAFLAVHHVSFLFSLKNIFCLAEGFEEFLAEEIEELQEALKKKDKHTNFGCQQLRQLSQNWRIQCKWKVP